jgi:hypothetical protein
MNSLQQKLNQLSLTSMSHQLDQAITDAAARNLSLAQALESLVDLELESATAGPSSAASVSRGCMPGIRSTAFTSNTTRAVQN